VGQAQHLDASAGVNKGFLLENIQARAAIFFDSSA